ncbi:MAG: PEP-CTERM sorting domain-containing protein [Isosphaeraceae bacterium]|nr:PEP-CTERM sorting domain-containing protein [Isosphaeraceae bacterium]
MMMNRGSRLRRVRAVGWSILPAICLAWGSTALGGLSLSTEVLIDNQAANVVFLVYFQGLDADAALGFTHLNTVQNSFDYQSDPGGVYAGKAFQNSSRGDYDLATDGFSFQSTGSLGGDTWSTTGTASLDHRIDGSVEITYHYDYYNALAERAAQLSFVSLITPVGPGVFYPTVSVGSGVLILPSGQRIEIYSRDYVTALGNWFNQTIPDDLDPYQCGFTDPVTGVGFSTVYFKPPGCPEPSTLSALGVGILFAATGLRRVRRDSRLIRST